MISLYAYFENFLGYMHARSRSSDVYCAEFSKALFGAGLVMEHEVAARQTLLAGGAHDE
jgi:hypothetical protein